MTSTELQPRTTTGHALDTSLPPAADLATAWLEQAGLSANTRSAYATDLRDYYKWLTSLPTVIHPLRADRLVADQYARSLEARGLAKATQARRLAALSSFYDYCESLELIVRNPVLRVKRPKVSQVSQTLGVDRHEATVLLDEARQHSPVTFALVALLAGLGLRVSEACGVDLEDFGTQAGQNQLHRLVTVHRKGGMTQPLPLSPLVATAVDAVVQQAASEGRTTGPLLTDERTGDRLTRHQAAYRLKKTAIAAGIDSRLTPHGLRHQFVTTALASGSPLHKVQAACGHADPRTTERYDKQRLALDGHAAYTVGTALAS